VFENCLDAIHEFVGACAKLGSPAEIGFAIETKDHVLISALLLKGFQVFHLNPKQSDRFRDRFAPSGRKSDELDALVLASALRTDPHLFHVIEEMDEDLFRISRMVASRERFRAQGEASIHRICNELARTFPDLLKLGSLYDTVWFRALVARFPVPSYARKATADALGGLVPAQCRKVDQAALLATLTSARSAMSEAHEEVIAKDLQVELASAELCIAREQRLYRALAKEIEALASAKTENGRPSDAAILSSIPGLGAMTSAILLTQAGAALDARNLKGLRAISGTAPVTSKSGKQGRPGGRKPDVSMRRACRSDLRNALHHMASNNIQLDPRSKKYYAALRARGIEHAAALRRVADQVTRLMITLLEKGQLFDAQRRQQERPPRIGGQQSTETMLTVP
jgi:transposase